MKWNELHDPELGTCNKNCFSAIHIPCLCDMDSKVAGVSSPRASL